MSFVLCKIKFACYPSVLQQLTTQHLISSFISCCSQPFNGISSGFGIVIHVATYVLVKVLQQSEGTFNYTYKFTLSNMLLTSSFLIMLAKESYANLPDKKTFSRTSANSVSNIFDAEIAEKAYEDDFSSQFLRPFKEKSRGGILQVRTLDTVYFKTGCPVGHSSFC